MSSFFTNPDLVEVAGDGQHFEALIVSSAFRGLARLARHRLVYAALGDRMRAEIHALSVTTQTPEEHAARKRGMLPCSGVRRALPAPP